MSMSTILGFLFGVGLFLAAVVMGSNNYMAFLNEPSLMIVFGGTISVAFMSYQARYVNIAFKSIPRIFKKPLALREGLNKEIQRLIEWGYAISGGKGVVALDKASAGVDDPLLRYGVSIVSVGHKPVEVRSMLETYVESEFDRVTVPVNVLKNMGATAPAFGMIGTLVGLVQMLQGLGNDMAALGAGMAVALLTTLYGVLASRLVFIPAADKLQQRYEIERFRNLLIIEGLVMLSEQRNPRYMQDKLNSFLDPSIHFDIDRQLNR